MIRLAAALLCVAQAWGQGVGHWENRAPVPILATEVSSAAIGDKVYTKPSSSVWPSSPRARRGIDRDDVGHVGAVARLLYSV